MLKSIKTSFKDTIIYGMGNVAVKVVGLLLIPVYTNHKYFSTDQFGVYGVLEISAIILTAVMASALPQSLTRWYWDKDHRDNQKGIFFMAIATQVVVSLAFCLVLIPLAGSMSVMIFSKPDWGKVISFVIIASAIQAINNVVNTLMRLQSRSVLYTVTNLIKLVIVLGLTLYLILVRKMGLEAIYLAQVFGNGLVALILLGYTVRNSRIFIDFNILRSMSAYGFPLLIANFSAAALNAVDRFALNGLTVLKSVAIYTLATKVTSTLKLILVDSIKLAVGPMMIKRMDSSDNRRFYSKVLLYSSYVLMFGILGVSLFSFEIVKVLTKSKDFWGAVVVIPVLSLSIFFINMKEITVYGLHIAKKTRIIGIIVALSTLVTILLNLLLIPAWDIQGAAISTLLAQLIYWYACHYYSQKAFYVPYETGKIALLLVVGAGLSFTSLLLNGMALVPRIMLKLACFGSFPFILYLFNFYEPVELQAIRGFFNKWSKISNLKSNLESLKGIADDL